MEAKVPLTGLVVVDETLGVGCAGVIEEVVVVGLRRQESAWETRHRLWITRENLPFFIVGTGVSMESILGSKDEGALRVIVNVASNPRRVRVVRTLFVSAHDLNVIDDAVVHDGAQLHGAEHQEDVEVVAHAPDGVILDGLVAVLDLADHVVQQAALQQSPDLTTPRVPRLVQRQVPPRGAARERDFARQAVERRDVAAHQEGREEVGRLVCRHLRGPVGQAVRAEEPGSSRMRRAAIERDGMMWRGELVSEGEVVCVPPHLYVSESEKGRRHLYFRHSRD
ncbi:hypothetical protein EDB81DRAFT_764759 [Dactylonectria macrodidyma]|uniref:Uncharacterized protein n=1 Tax=Dactylonectria macrodidyma TaxID=307937 RepID=A0A9P9DYJ0_9HYPO|nr:hypothetical protein EDB81DRAFT_764759 [Dactylonectria macrodidyma]